MLEEKQLMERFVLACGLRVLSIMVGTLWWEHLLAVMACSYLDRSGSRKIHANTQLPFSVFPSYLVWDHGMELHAFTCLPPSFNHLWKCIQTCSKVCPTKVFPNPVHWEFQFLIMVIVTFVEKLLYTKHFNDYLFLNFMIIGIKISQFSFLL